MPPACWENDPPARRSRGSRYCKQRQFDLGLAFGSAGVLREDVQDHRGAVDRRAPEDLLQVALLGRREVVFEDHGVGVERETDLAKFLYLARAEERRGIGRVATLDDARDDVGAGRVDQQRQFVELVVEFVLGDTRELHADEHDLLAKRAIDEGIGYIGHASSHSTFATNCTGPLSVAAAPSSVTCSAPPGLSTVTSVPHISSRCATAATATRAGAAGPRPTDAAFDHLDRQVIVARRRSGTRR